MSELIPSEPTRRTCPLLILQMGSPRLPEFTVISSNVIYCTETCEGIKSEPRVVGGIVLPRLFDRTYCDNTR